MGVIADTMPLIARQTGVWEGEYVHFDAHHREIDRHKSRLLCRIEPLDEGGEKLVQTNIYDWEDGTCEVRYFEGVLAGDRINIFNENIIGCVWPLEKDETQRTIMVLWTRTNVPDFRFYEMITVSEDYQHKNRTWHWYQNGRLFRRTLINEVHSGHDWQAHDHPDYYQYRQRAPR